MKKTFLACTIMIGISGCYKAHPVTNDTIVYDAQAHKLQSQNLKDVMHSLDVSISNNYKSELEKEDTRVRYALRLSEDIQHAVVLLREMGKNEFEKRFSKEDTKIYYENVARLEYGASEIGTVAQRYEVEKLDGKIKNLQLTCLACHTRFKVKHGH